MCVAQGLSGQAVLDAEISDIHEQTSAYKAVPMKLLFVEENLVLRRGQATSDNSI